MLPWLIIWNFLSQKNLSLAELVALQREKFPSSGEINFTTQNPEECLTKIKNNFISEAYSIDDFDGISMTDNNCRINIRKSNTEPLIRVNIETKVI